MKKQKLTKKEKFIKDIEQFDIYYIYEHYRKDKRLNSKKFKYDLKTFSDIIYWDYIRYKYKDSSWMVVCVTCWKKYHYLKRNLINNWHYRPRNIMKYRYNDINCYPQCIECNIFLKWNYRNYYLFISKKLWKKKEEEIWNDTENIKIGKEEYINMIKKWYKFIINN